jgi:ACS family hexuronate transporter-like MFS transporter
MADRNRVAAQASYSSGDSLFPAPRARWTICGMLFFATSINYIDRQVLGILAPTLQHSIGWTEAQYGYIIGAFQVAYAIGLVAAGRLVDKLGSRTGFAILMAFWSAASMAHALASTALGFGIARFFLGLGESGSFPAAIKTVAEWFSPKERSLATGIFNSGAGIGAILAPALIPWITLHWGWRAAFLATGIVGALWLAWWMAKYRRPEEHPDVTPEELKSFVGETPKESPDGTNGAKAQVPWKSLLGYRQTWGFVLAKFLTDPIWWFYLYWLPKFFDAKYHLGLSQIGVPLIVVYNLSMMGSVGGGWLPTLFRKQGLSMEKSRLTAMLICASMVLPMFFASHAASLWIAVGLLSLAAAAHQGWSANLFTTVSDMFPKSVVGAVVGIGGMAGSVGGVLFSLSTGWVLQVTHSYTPLFAVAASAYLVGLLLLQLLAPGLRPIPSWPVAKAIK